MKDRLVIVGATARAAASLATGRELVTCDLFADEDLQRIAQAHRILARDFPDGFAPWAEQLPPSDWMYTGGVENAAQVVEHIAGRHRLLGCSSKTLRAVRDPFQVAAALEAAAVPVAPIARPSQLAERFDRHCADLSCVEQIAGPTTQQWLCKPFKSCGGMGINVFHSRKHAGKDATHYCQQCIHGASQAGLFLANKTECRLLGVTESWSMSDDHGVFQYGGSLGPIDVSGNGRVKTAARANWQRIGDVLTAQFQLVGLFGVDAIKTSGGNIVPLEVNPRFTASMELLPLVEDQSVVEWHLATCESGCLPETTSIHHAAGFHGKGIMYTPEPLQFSGEIRSIVAAVAKSQSAQVADIPPEGTWINRGQPLITVFCRDDNPDLARQRLSWRGGSLFASIWAGIKDSGLG